MHVNFKIHPPFFDAGDEQLFMNDQANNVRKSKKKEIAFINEVLVPICIALSYFVGDNLRTMYSKAIIIST